MDEHKVKNVGGTEVWESVDYEDVDSVTLNNIVRTVGIRSYYIGHSVVWQLKQGWAIFLGAASDPQGFSQVHFYVPEKLTLHQIQQLVRVLEHEYLQCWCEKCNDYIPLKDFCEKCGYCKQHCKCIS